ncbi:MAG: glycosyltransferase family 4 protein [bacterium]|nr:glycosyltransferase family 4 protein [bacterium]
MPGSVAFVVKGWPRLSETFIAQEILALERRGLDIRIVSLRHPTTAPRHAIHDAVRAPVTWLPEYLHEEPGRTWRAWRRARKLPGYASARRHWLADLWRDPTRNRVRRFGQACVVATEIAPAVNHLHAHFLHTPASVTRYAAMMTGLSWSASAHARDIYTTPRRDLADKMSGCSWLVTCTAANRDWLESLVPGRRVSLAYHGIDQARWPSPVRPTAMRDGSNPDDPVRLVTVGRAVEKKGYGTLLAALALLPDDLHWHLTHAGDGPLLSSLVETAARRGLKRRITWLGARRQDEILEVLREGDLFVLAPLIARDGDRDGLPNVLLEAQSQALAVATTDVSAVGELVTDGANGFLVPPDDAPALASRLSHLARNPQLRDRMGRNGEDRVRTEFSMESGIDRLVGLFSSSGITCE